MSLTAELFAPAASLRPYIAHYWSYAFPSVTREWSPWQQCLPAGKAEIIIHLDSGRHLVAYNGRTELLPEAQIIGVHTEPVRWQIPGQSEVFGIQVTMEGFLRLFSRPLGDIGGLYADMRDFCTPAELQLVDLVQSAYSHSERVERLNRFFLSRLGDPRPAERYVIEAVRSLEQRAGQYSIEALSGEVFIGTRQLQRTFREYVGISPKVYSRIVRFRTAYDYLILHPNAGWAEISYRFGYADQSHFIRDFKQFTGNAPTVFLTNFRPFPASIFAFAAA